MIFRIFVLVSTATCGSYWKEVSANRGGRRKNYDDRRIDCKFILSLSISEYYGLNLNQFCDS
jgi:hypothetical protein